MEMKIEPLALPGVDTQRPIVIAGPCSAETEEQVLETAQGLASRGVKIFRRVFGSLVRNRVDSRASEPRDWLG